MDGWNKKASQETDREQVVMEWDGAVLLPHRVDISVNTVCTLLLKNPPVYEFYGMFPAGNHFLPLTKGMQSEPPC